MTDWPALRPELGARTDEGPLRVAIVTAYHREPEAYLEACHASVKAQTYPCTHIVVADGHPSPLALGWGAQHITLPIEHGNYGSTPRAVGGLSAVAQGFDAIAYLDADNWYDPHHVQSMVDLHRQSGAGVCVASRTLRRLNGSLLDVAGEGGDGVSHVDTNCLFLTAPAFRVIPLWGLIPRALSAMDDRIVWMAIKRLGLPIARRRKPSVHYRTSFRVHYEERGEVPPPESKGTERVKQALETWNTMSNEEREMVFRRLGL